MLTELLACFKASPFAEVSKVLEGVHFLLDTLHQDKLAFITGSRGCIFSCIYCANPAIYTNKIRYRSPGNILAEIRTLYALGYRMFSFRDEIFTANPSRTRELVAGLKALQSEGLYIKWFCQTRADLLNETLIVEMKDAGLVKIAFGIESGDPAAANYLKHSRINMAKCEKNQQLATENGIRVANYFIFGGPRQSWQSMFQSLLFAKRQPPDHINTEILTDFPGNLTAGLPRAVLETEAHLAAALFSNHFYLGQLHSDNPQIIALLATLRKFYANCYRLAVMADLYFRSCGGYTDRDRISALKKASDELSTAGPAAATSFMIDYANLLALRELGTLPHIETNEHNYLEKPEAQFEKRIEQLHVPLCRLASVMNLGVHPKVADAYFDEFLTKARLANVEHSLIGFSAGGLTRFFLTAAILREIAKNLGIAPSETIELDADSRENGPALAAHFEKLKMSEVAARCSQTFVFEKPPVGIDLNLYGLPVVLDGKQHKIIMKASTYRPAEELSVALVLPD